MTETELTQAKRLALVVDAEVASIRADQARERAVLINRQARPVVDAFERFEELYGREPDTDVPGDQGEISRLLAAAGGASISQEMAEAVVNAADDSAQAAQVASAAHLAVAAAMRASGATEHTTTLQWLGVDDETYDRALAAALEDA